jgi:hypothetical protein
VAAAQVKVVIVVGPVEGSTAKYISHAQGYAAFARSLGASVTEVTSSSHRPTPRVRPCGWIRRTSAAITTR